LISTKILKTFLLVNVLVYSAEYAVIIDKDSSVSKLSSKQLKDIYLMKRHFIGSTKIVPINLPSELKIRNEFEKHVLHLNREELNRYWVKKHFQGVTPPVMQSSDKSMKLFVKNVNGAIGYLPISQVDSDLKVIYEF